jgi:hypothetical protein
MAKADMMSDMLQRIYNVQQVRAARIRPEPDFSLPAPIPPLQRTWCHPHQLLLSLRMAEAG